MTLEPVVGVAKSSFCLLKQLFATFVYIFIHLHHSLSSPELCPTMSDVRCHYPLITYCRREVPG